MPKWFKLLLGLLLLPACLAAAETLGHVLKTGGRALTFWWAFGFGAGAWFLIFILLPRPMWLYVVGHEFTHVLWAWLFGARLKKFKATSKGGHVVLTRNNFLIALAPYFFPFYSFLVVLVFVLGHLLWDWSRHQNVFHFCLGLSYAFHLTLTACILRHRQSDITGQGRLFSFVIIFLGNISVLLLGLPVLTRGVSAADAFILWGRLTAGVWLRCLEFLERLV